MNLFSTSCVNTLRQQSKVLIAAILLAMPLRASIADESVSSEIKIDLRDSEILSKSKSTLTTKFSDVEKLSATEGRRIQFLEMNPLLLQFEFPQFTYRWLTSKSQFNIFWKENSKVSGDAPTLNINWRTESLLALFWQSKDAVVRIPTFMGSEELDDNGAKSLRLTFGLNTPCFGIITSNSPVMFLVVDHNFADLDSIALRTETTKSTGCF